MKLPFLLLICMFLSFTGFAAKDKLVNPNATKEAVALYDFLNDQFGNRTLSGVMTLASLEATSGENQNEIHWLEENTGKKPVILGLDFMDELHDSKNNPRVIEDATYWYNQNGIAVFCWHWRDPSQETEQFYSPSTGKEHYTDFDVSKVFDTESSEYKAMLYDIDQISERLKKLQSAGIPIVWRPLHEASGGWFWWGYKGAEPCKELWKIMYERMVNHHKINNLIWVWTSHSNENDPEWYPGDDYVDIIGMDIYQPKYSHESHIRDFDAMREFFGKDKIIALSECGSIPSVANMQTDGAYWSWFMPWYGGFTKTPKHNSIEIWNELMHSEYIITLDEMPNLNEYKSAK